MLPLCARARDRVPGFSPLAGGWLTGKYRRDEPFPVGSRMTLRPDVYEGFVHEEVFGRFDELEARAAARGVEPAMLALAWLLSNPDVGAVVVGPRRPSQLETVWAAADLPLDAAERDGLSELFA